MKRSWADLTRFKNNDVQKPEVQSQIHELDFVPNQTWVPQVSLKARVPQKPREKPARARTAKEMHMRRWQVVSQRADASFKDNVLKAMRKVHSRKSDPKNPKPTLGVLQSLVNHNAISDEGKKPQLEKAPEYKATTKKKHLNELLANCPKTSDMQKNRLHNKALEDAVDRFGMTKSTELKPEKGKWRHPHSKSSKSGDLILYSKRVH